MNISYAIVLSCSIPKSPDTCPETLTLDTKRLSKLWKSNVAFLQVRSLPSPKKSSNLTFLTLYVPPNIALGENLLLHY